MRTRQAPQSWIVCAVHLHKDLGPGLVETVYAGWYHSDR